MAGPLPAPRRGFRLGELMILVATASAWLALTRHFAARSNLRTIWYLSDNGPLFMLKHQFSLLFGLLAVATIAIRLIPPRPRGRRLWRQPGFAACVAAVVAATLNALQAAISIHATLGGWGSFGAQNFWQEWPLLGPAVAGAWLMLIASGRWRAEPGAVDRIGRLVGVFWLAEFFLAEVQFGRWTVILPRLLGK